MSRLQLVFLLGVGSSEVLAGDGPVTREYPLKDIVQVHPDYPAPHVGLWKGPEKQVNQDQDQLRKDRVQDLVRLIRTVVSSGAWQGGWAVEEGQDSLKVTAPEAVQREVSELLEGVRSRTGRLVKVETAVFALDGKALGRLSPQVRRALGLVAFAGPGEAPSRKDLEEILEAASREGRQRKNPEVTAFDGQLTHSLVMNQKAYIADVEGEGTSASAVIGVLRTGPVVEVRPAIGEDGKHAVLDLRYTLVETPGPSQKRVVQGIPVEVPREVRTEFKVVIDVPSGEWRLAGVSLPREGALVGLLVKAKVQDLSRSTRP